MKNTTRSFVILFTNLRIHVGSRTELRLACLLRALELWRRDPALANRRWDQSSDFIATSVVWAVDPLVLSEEFLADPSEDLEGWIRPVPKEPHPYQFGDTHDVG